MASQSIQVPPDSTGKKVQTFENVISAQAVEAQAVCLVDSAGVEKVTMPVSGTVTTTPPANASENLNQIAGTTPDVNSGLKSAGTLRVVLATDQPALTNKLLTTPDLPAGASTAAKQPALGVAGTPSADVITVQGAASMTKLLVTPDSVALPANQSVNVAQFAGSNAVSSGIAGVVRFAVMGGTGGRIDTPIAATAAAAQAVQTAALYNSTIPALATGNAVAQQCDTAGSLYVNEEGRKATYRMAVRGFTPVASASSPLFSIQGSATKTVRLLRLRVTWYCTTGTALPNAISLQKFSALTGGTTGNTPTGSLNDSNNAAQTAICLQYSAVPTTATVIGGIHATEMMTWITAGVSTPTPPAIDWSWNSTPGQSLVLRGTAEYFGVVVAAIGTTPVMSIWAEWSEE